MIKFVVTTSHKMSAAYSHGPLDLVQEICQYCGYYSNILSCSSCNSWVCSACISVTEKDYLCCVDCAGGWE